MTELERISELIKSKKFASMSRAEKKTLRDREQILLRKMVKDVLKEHLEPLLMRYNLDSDIRIYNDGDDGIKVDFVEFWSDVDTPTILSEATQQTEIISHSPSETTVERTASQNYADGQPFLEHKLDWSPFMYGFTIDTKYHEAANKAVGKVMERGETVYAKLLIDNCCFDVKFDNPDIKTRKDHIMRLLYKGKGDTPGDYLKRKFPETFSYIKCEKDMFGGKHQVKIPELLQENLSFYTTDEPLVFRMTYKKTNDIR